MIYSLDSNAVSDILKGRYGVAAQMEKLKQNVDDEFAICAITHYEVARGLLKSGATKKLRDFSDLYKRAIHLPFDETAAEIAANIYVDLHKGRLIEDNDIFIAAIAIVNDCTLVTANAKHLSRINGLKCVDWR